MYAKKLFSKLEDIEREDTDPEQVDIVVHRQILQLSPGLDVDEDGEYYKYGGNGSHYPSTLPRLEWLLASQYPFVK
jgi:hypothetical protein